MAARRAKSLKDQVKCLPLDAPEVQRTAFLGAAAALLAAGGVPSAAAALGFRARCVANKLQGELAAGALPVCGSSRLVAHAVRASSAWHAILHTTRQPAISKGMHKAE